MERLGHALPVRGLLLVAETAAAVAADVARCPPLADTSGDNRSVASMGLYFARVVATAAEGEAAAAAALEAVTTPESAWRWLQQHAAARLDAAQLFACPKALAHVATWTLAAVQFKVESMQLHRTEEASAT